MQPSPWTIERHPTVGSTMDEARKRARAGAPDGTVVVAEQMSSGRGTHGRSWMAPKGGLYLSVVLRGVGDPHLLTLALGNAVAEALEVAGVEPRLKWVNDVLVAGPEGGPGRKMAGILVEGEATGDQFDFLVAGIGVNVNGHAADLPGLAQVATTLEDSLGCDSCVPDLEALLLDRVAHWLGKVRAGADAEIVEAFRSRDALKGHRVRVKDGTAVVEGTAQGIDDQGRLLVRTASETQPLLTGSVQLL